MRTVLDGVAIALGVGFGAAVVITVVLVTRHRPPQPPRTRGQAARVRGTWRRSWSYQRYIISEIRRGARGGKRH